CCVGRPTRDNQSPALFVPRVLSPCSSRPVGEQICGRFANGSVDDIKFRPLKVRKYVQTRMRVQSVRPTYGLEFAKCVFQFRSRNRRGQSVNSGPSPPHLEGFSGMKSWIKPPITSALASAL